MTEAEYSDRQHMVNEIKKMLPDTSELSVESDGFFLSEEHKKLISEIGAANPIRSHTIPNSIAGNLLDAKVLVISANVGTAKEDGVFEKVYDVLGGVESAKVNDVLRDPYVLDDTALFKGLTFSKAYQRIFLPENKWMKGLVERIKSTDNPAELFYTLIHEIEKLYDIEVKNWKNEYWKSFQFYAYIALPLLNTKYSFDSLFGVPPVSLLFNARYGSIDGNKNNNNDLKFAPSLMNIGGGEWPKFVERSNGVTVESLKFQKNAWLGSRVEHLKDIMVMQEFPYRTDGVDDLKNPGLKIIYEQYLNVIKKMLKLIANHNKNFKKDKIDVVLTRKNWFKNEPEISAFFESVQNEGWLFKTQYNGKTFLTYNNVVDFSKWLEKENGKI